MEYGYSNIVNPDLDRLIDDITNSAMSVKSVITCNYNEDTNILIINFSDILDSSDENLLNNIVSSLVSENTSKFKINSSYSTPSDLNFNLFGLHKEELINSLGFMYEVKYYKNYVDGVYSDLVVKDEYQYSLNENDLVTHRVETITWYLEDNSVGEVKQITKYYDTQAALNEGIRRRTNLINKGKAYLMANIQGIHDVPGEPVMPNSYYFFTLVADEVSLYINGLKDYLVTAIQDSTESYMTSEIKTGVISIIKYW